MDRAVGAFDLFAIHNGAILIKFMEKETLRNDMIVLPFGGDLKKLKKK